MVPYPEQDEKAALIRDLDRARKALGIDLAALGHAADLRRAVRASWEGHRGKWLAGAGIAGWLLAGCPGLGRKKAPAGRLAAPGRPSDKWGRALVSGAVLTVLKFGLSAAKPALADFLQNKLARLIVRR